MVLGYLLGSCPWGYWLVRLVKHEDIRKVGSGNIGATNVWRTYGRWLGVPVVVLDVLKGFIPAMLGMLFVSPHSLSGVARRRGRDARPLAPALPRVREGRQDGRDVRRRVLRRRRVGRADGRRRLARRLPASRATRRSPRSWPGSPCRSAPTSTATRRRSSSSARWPQPAILFLHRANLGRLRVRDREPLPLQARRECVGSSSSSVFCAALWLSPGAFAAGWCGGNQETGADRADIVTAPADSRCRRDPVRREPIRSRPTPAGSQTTSPRC